MYLYFFMEILQGNVKVNEIILKKLKIWFGINPLLTLLVTKLNIFLPVRLQR